MCRWPHRGLVNPPCDSFSRALPTLTKLRRALLARGLGQVGLHVVSSRASPGVLAEDLLLPPSNSIESAPVARSGSSAPRAGLRHQIPALPACGPTVETLRT